MLQLRMTSRVLGAVAACAIATLGMGAAEAQSNERRIATLAPPGSAWMKVLDRGAAEIERATDGRVKTTYYAGGSQGDERDVVRKMRLGQLDGAALTSVGLSMIDESIRVLELPMMFRDVQEMDYVRNKMWPYFQKKFDEKGFILGDPGDVGWVYFFSRTPVNSLGDLRNTRVWMWTDDQLVRAMFRKLNVNGVPLGVPDVLSALQSGRINACYGSPLAAVALQWSTRVRYMTSMPMSYSIGGSVLRKEAYEQASVADRRIQDKIARVQGNRLRRIVRKDNEEAQRQMVRAGVKVIDTPADMVRDFEKAAQEVWKELAGRLYTQKELDMVIRYRDEYRAKNP
jgi:TRAP-type transport system periplasmic protein